MFRTTLAVALTAASLGLATPANALWDVVVNGTSLNGCSAQGTSFNGYEQDGHPIARAAPRVENAESHVGPAATEPLTVEAVILAAGAASRRATAADRTQEAETTPLVVEAFLSNVPVNGTSLDGISTNVTTEQGKLRSRNGNSAITWNVTAFGYVGVNCAACNGTSLDGISASVWATLPPAGDVKFGYLGNNPGHFSGSGAAPSGPLDGISQSINGYEQGADPTDRAGADTKGADPRAAAAKPAPLTVEAFLQVSLNGISLNGVTLNGGQAQGYAAAESGFASSAFAVEAIVLRSGETVDLR
jgi:hypothetical protein